MFKNTQSGRWPCDSPLKPSERVENAARKRLLPKRTPLGPIEENVPELASPSTVHREHSRTGKTTISRRASVFSSVESPSLWCSERLVSPTVLKDEDTCSSGDKAEENTEPWKRCDLVNFWRSEFEPFCPYAHEIYQNLASVEYKVQPLSLYLDRHIGINSRMRATLVEWLSDIVHGCGYNPETLFASINYLDRYMSYSVLNRFNLQLVGITCLFISCKLNDVKVPAIDEYAYVTDSLYTTDNIIEIEKDILYKLEFNLMVPTVLSFTEFYASYFGGIFLEAEVLSFMRALCEFVLVDYILNNSYYSSVLGAAILSLVSYYVGFLFRIRDFSVFKLDLAAVTTCYHRLFDLMQHLDTSHCHSAVERLRGLWLPERFIKISPQLSPIDAILLGLPG